MLGCRKSGTLTSSRHFPDTSGLCRLCFPFCVLRSSRAKRWFVKLALAVATSFAVLRAGFVQGLGWDQSRPVKVCTKSPRGKLWSWVWSCGPEANDQHQKRPNHPMSSSGSWAQPRKTPISTTFTHQQHITSWLDFIGTGRFPRPLTWC